MSRCDRWKEKGQRSKMKAPYFKLFGSVYKIMWLQESKGDVMTLALTLPLFLLNNLFWAILFVACKDGIYVVMWCSFGTNLCVVHLRRAITICCLINILDRNEIFYVKIHKVLFTPVLKCYHILFCMFVPKYCFYKRCHTVYRIDNK